MACEAAAELVELLLRRIFKRGARWGSLLRRLAAR